MRFNVRFWDDCCESFSVEIKTIKQLKELSDKYHGYYDMMIQFANKRYGRENNTIIICDDYFDYD